MMTAQLVEFVSSGILILSLNYLIWRTLKQVVVQQRSYQQLPFEDVQGVGVLVEQAKSLA